VTLIYAAIACQIFLASVPIFSRGLGEKNPEFLPKANGKFKRPFTVWLNQFSLIHCIFGTDFVTRQVDKFSLISSYGLFRRMTGVGGRPEIILVSKVYCGNFSQAGT
jgi:hypothetical protein